METEKSGWFTARREAKDTKAVGVDDSAMGSAMEDHLGGIKLNPLV
ncbi:MAG TPA: hypothetical protein VMG82_24415 [Candidatus Sulfotelmatobacter sp.]|nr:hypothetical protein [Candidatus Sulfotelmatobacter sp.]